MKGYDRYYCYKDQEYAPEDIGSEAATAEPLTPPPLEASSFDELISGEPEAHADPEAPSESEPIAVSEERAEEPPEALPARSLSEPVTDSTEPSVLQPEPTPTPSRTPVMEALKVVSAPPSAKPPLVKEEVLRAKKTTLMDLAAAYGLDTFGTKEELRVRLLAEYNRLRREEARVAGLAHPSFDERSSGEPPETQPRSFLDSQPPEPFESPGRAIPAHAIGTARPRPTKSADAEPFGDDLVRSQALLLPGNPRIINPCPTCGRELTYIERYDRYFCEPCKTYAPPPVKVVDVPPPPRVGRPCTTCGRELTYVEQYDRHYCYNCKAYAPLESRTSAPPPESASKILEPKLEAHVPEGKNPCPTCGKELVHIARYARYYCYDCEKYAPPRPKHPCSNCGKALTFVAQYRRHYCYACARYAPADLTAKILAERAVMPAAASASAPRVGIPVRPITVHRHGSLSAPVGIAVAGLALILALQILVAMPLAMGAPPYVDLDPLIAWSLQFLGLLLLGVGAIAGFVQLRSRK